MESCVLLQTPSRHWCSAALQATLQNTCRRENFEKVEERSTAVRLPVSCFACRNALSSQARPVWNLKASPSPPAFPHSAEGGELTERTFHWVCLQ